MMREAYIIEKNNLAMNWTFGEFRIFCYYI